MFLCDLLNSGFSGTGEPPDTVAAGALVSTTKLSTRCGVTEGSGVGAGALVSVEGESSTLVGPELDIVYLHWNWLMCLRTALPFRRVIVQDTGPVFFSTALGRDTVFLV